MIAFKVGDRVKVVRAFTDEEYPDIGWEPEMKKCVGELGWVDGIDQDGDVGVVFTNDKTGWWFPPSVLEKVED